MGEQTTFVGIVGEPFLSRAKVYREELRIWNDAWATFAKERGADSISRSGTALGFKNADQPAGWTRPAGPSRMSHPKKGHADIEVLAQLRECFPRPDARFVFGDEVPSNLNWETPAGGRGSCGIGSMGMILNGPWVGWAGETYLGWMPDPAQAARDILVQYPDARVIGSAVDWTMPEGLIRITTAEYELILAQHKVFEERAAANSGATA